MAIYYNCQFLVAYCKNEDICQRQLMFNDFEDCDGFMLNDHV